MMKNRILCIFFLITVATVSFGCSNDDFYATGTVEAKTVRISSSTGGELVRLYAEEGDAVNSGDLLAEMSLEEYDLLLEKAEAGFRLAESTLEEALHTDGEELRIGILASEAAGIRAEALRAEYEQASADLERMRHLADAGAVAEAEYEKAQLAAGSLEKGCLAAEKEAEMAAEQLKILYRGAGENTAKRLEAQLAAAAAERELAAFRQSETKIEASAGGTVTAVYHEEGENLLPGTSVFEITDLSDLKLKVYVPETILPRIVMGGEAEITIDAFPDRTFAGEVVYIGSSAQFTPKNVQTREQRTTLVFPVKVKINDDSGYIKPGLPADVRFTGGSSDE